MHWNVATVTHALEQVHVCRPLVLQEFKRLVDDYTGQARPIEYYDLIAGDWLEHFVHLTYLAWSRATGADGTAGGEAPLMATATPSEFRRASQADADFHRSLDTAVVALLAGASPANWKFTPVATEVCTSESRTPLGKRLAEAIGDRTAPVLICSPYYRCDRLQWLGALMRLRRLARWNDLNESIRVPAALDATWRRRQASAAGPTGDLTGILRSLLPLLMPIAYLECFAALRRTVLALPVARPLAVYTGQALHGHLVFKLLMAEWRREGTRLLNHQHGGGYGLDRLHTPEEYECRIADQFYTWGWRNDNPRVVPMSSTPPPLGGAGSSKRTRVALCCVDFPKFDFRLHYHPMSGSVQTMQRETIAFIRTFADHGCLVVRPSQTDFGSGFSRLLNQEEAAGTVLDRSGGRPFRFYATSKVVVHNYLGTSWLETLAMNIPTVCFFDPDTYAFRSDAQSHIDDLAQVGILHRSGPDAARFVKGLGDDVPGWWNRADVRIARQAFVERYANFAQDWPAQWEREFDRQVGIAN